MKSYFYLNCFKFFFLLLTIMFLSCFKEKKCIDADGNIYKTIMIGNQLWMAENLKTTHYNDGTPIPSGYFNLDWVKLRTGAYSTYPYNNDSISQATCELDCSKIYGNLYNWYAIYHKNICPTGFRIPSHEDWLILSKHLSPQGSDSLLEFLPINNKAGSMLKSKGTIEDNDGLWLKDNLLPLNEYGTNISGFNAYPGGYRNCNSLNGGYFEWMGKVSYYWSSSENQLNNNMAWAQEMWYHDKNIISFYHNKWTGFNVRCIGN